jgi:hypothetical protein
MEDHGASASRSTDDSPSTPQSEPLPPTGEAGPVAYGSTGTDPIDTGPAAMSALAEASTPVEMPTSTDVISTAEPTTAVTTPAEPTPGPVTDTEPVVEAVPVAAAVGAVAEPATVTDPLPAIVGVVSAASVVGSEPLPADGLTTDVLDSDVLGRDVLGVRGVDMPDADVLTNGAGAGPFTVAGTAPTRARRRLVTTLVAAGVTLAVLAGVGAYAAYQRFFHDTRHPEQYTPASVAAFVAVDLDPSIDQQVKLARLVGKLRHAGGSAGSNLDVTGSLGRMLDRLHLTNVDAKRDLTSWLGLRAGFSVWTGPQSVPYLLIAVTATDENKAKQGLGRIKAGLGHTDQDLGHPDLGFVVHGGVALIAIGDRDSQRAAEAADTEARTSPLSGLTAFQDARHWLGAAPLVLIWTELDQIGKLNSLMSVPGLSSPAEGALGQDTPAPTSSALAKGTEMIGIRATDDGFDARFRVSPAPAAGTGPVHDALARLAALPANTQVGAVAGLPAQMGQEASQLGLGLGMMSTLPFGLMSMPDLMFGGPGAGNPFGGLSTMEPGPLPTRSYSEADMKEIEALLSKNPADLTDAESQRLRELIGYSPKDLLTLASPGPTPLSMPSGLPMPTDLATPNMLPGLTSGLLDPFTYLAGATLTVAVTSLPSSPQVHVVADLASADTATHLTQDTRGLPSNVTLAVDGTTVTVTTAGYSAGSGALGGDPLYQKTMAGAPAQSSIALYANLETALTPKARSALAIRSVGIVAGEDGTGQIRVLIG